MELDEYQRAAAETDQIAKHGPHDAIAAMLGLASDVGSILNLYKKHIRYGIDLATNRSDLREGLGDALWYIAAIARSFDLSLAEIAEANLMRTGDIYAPGSLSMEGLASFDSGFPPQERFPRKLVVQFLDEQHDDQRRATLVLIEADPNAFPHGPIRVPNRKKPLAGFALGQQLGDPLRDNSPVPDEYRFHDAVHMSFMAILGWSATFRAHLRVKRKSIPLVDETEDSIRSSFREEGLVAVLAQLSERRRGFKSPMTVDSTTLSIVDAVVSGLEVDVLPRWLWRRAISEGFRMMDNLRINNGGYLSADLDERTIEFSAEWPPKPAASNRGDTGLMDDVLRGIVCLHRQKDAAYGPAWKKRGEYIGVFANIARKVDRLELAMTGAPKTLDESILDTAVDLYIYCLKYETFLADLNRDIAHTVFGSAIEAPHSEGPSSFEWLITKQAAIRAVSARIEERVMTVERAFHALEESILSEPSVTAGRLTVARELRDAAFELLVTTVATDKAQAKKFVTLWLADDS